MSFNTRKKTRPASDFIPLDKIEKSSGDGASVDPPDGPRAATSMRSRRAPLMAPENQFTALNNVEISQGPTGTGSFFRDLQECGWEAFTPEQLDIVQINVGKLCNMTCRHCHVDSGPDRTDENMDRETVDACLDLIDRSGAETVDLTGGAPELNPHFEYLVHECAVERGLHVIDRCNLTILTTGRCEHLPEWMAERGVEIVCSLPHYRKLGTDAQRGKGTYDKSIRAIRRLNEVGYGQGNPDQQLTVMANPTGAFLAGDQASMERDWKKSLRRDHGITFDNLVALNNMPMSRYLEWLLEKGQLEAYMHKLVDAFNPATIGGLMCRNTLSISWDGYLYDCDFNQQLEMNMDLSGKGQPDVERPHVSDFSLDAWLDHAIRTERHCYGCTAGSGSGCGGAIEK